MHMGMSRGATARHCSTGVQEQQAWARALGFRCSDRLQGWARHLQIISHRHLLLPMPVGRSHLNLSALCPCGAARTVNWLTYPTQLPYPRYHTSSIIHISRHSVSTVICRGPYMLNLCATGADGSALMSCRKRHASRGLEPWRRSVPATLCSRSRTPDLTSG